MVKKILVLCFLLFLLFPVVPVWSKFCDEARVEVPEDRPCPNPTQIPTQPCVGSGCVGANIIEIKPPGGLVIYGLTATVSRITKYLLYAALAIAPFMVLYGAITLLFAQGEPNKVETGRNVIIWALVGLAIFLAAKILTNVVISALTP
jgi:hypothetical protein